MQPARRGPTNSLEYPALVCIRVFAQFVNEGCRTFGPTDGHSMRRAPEPGWRTLNYQADAPLA